MKSLSLSLIALVLNAVSSSPPLQLSPFEGFEGSPDYGGIFAGVRLPQDVTPLHYDLQIRPIINLPLDDPEQFTAPGVVQIRVKCLKATNNITLHANDIDIQHENVTVKYAETEIFIRVLDYSNDSSLSTYTIQLQATLDANVDYDLQIPFTSKVGNRLSGLYRSSYLDETGNRRWLATTQFQKLGARMAFPCFDEPNFRSTFNITIGRAVGYNSLANSALLETIPIPDMSDWLWDVHERTVPMPTYIIAIIVSDFVSVDAPGGISDYDVKIWGPPTMTNSATAEFSSKAAAQILTFFENYLQSSYQFPKLDSAAIPDFSAGAMENWALNTYRLNFLLYIDGESTQMEQWRQAAVIAHEISHHWFGDLVTCQWWNDIWLNEGFASYMEIIGANATGTQHGAMDRYPIDKFQLAMDFDAGPTTEPVRNNVTELVTNQPSRIIYEKAASLIRMMQSFLSEDTFIGGIRNYLDTYAYNNTVQDQLFAELQAQADSDGTLTQYTVKQIMDTWTLKSGFPIVRLQHAGGNSVAISQAKFVRQLEKDVDPFQSEGELWYVPISYATKANPDFSSGNWKPRFWIDKDTLTSIRFIEGAGTQWVIINPDARSYFRVIYDAHFFSMITGQLEENPMVISLASRSQMIDDYFKSAFAGYVRIEDALELTRYLSNEPENTVWTTVFNNLRLTNRLLQDTPFYRGLFQTYMLSKVTPVLDSIGWEQSPTDAPVTIILRTQLLDWACALGSPKCESVAIDYVTRLAEGNGIPADIQPMIYCKAVSISDSLDLPGEFNIKGYLLDQYTEATRAERHSVFVNALACDDPAYVENWLILATSNTSLFTTTHAIQLIQRIAENPVTRLHVVDYFQQNILRIIEVLGESAISSIASSVAAYTSEETLSDQLKTFIDDALLVVTSGNVRASLAASKVQLDTNVKWMDVWGTKIGLWLYEN